MGKAIGIDLGTTNTAVAVLVDGRPRVLEDDKGYKVLPSCVSVQPGGKTVVGQQARILSLTQPDRTVQAVKRLVGRRFDSPEADRIRRRAAYSIQPGSDGGCVVAMAGETYTPTQVSALVLQHARQIAEKALGETVDEAVITVPAYFNHAQRAATYEAAQLAGLRCERLLNEPTAAALAYGFRKDVNRTILIYDLGGGTFDVSVLQLSKGVYEVLSTAGETFLGGEDFDHRLVDHLAEHFQSRHGVDLRGDRETLQRLKDAAERAKCELSFTDRTTVLVPRITATENLELGVTRLQLEELVEDLVERTLQITRDAVQEAGLRIGDIDDVILVGGQTRMPRVREAIGALFQKEPNRSVHPEEVVAIGAAVHAHSLVDPDASKPLLLDVTPFDLGIEVAGGLFQPIINRNANIPASASRTFATAHDNQDNVQVTVRQGSSRFSAENEFLGRFVMSGLTPAPRMSNKVEVTFRLDSNGMLHVSATETATGERKRITIRNYAEIAQTDGKVEALIEGDGQAPAARSSLDDGAEAAQDGQDASSPAKGKKGSSKGAAAKAGLFSRLFGRKSSKAPAPADAPPEPSPDDAAEAMPVEPEPLEPQEVEPEPLEPEPLELGGDSLQALDDGALAPADEEPEPLAIGDLTALEPDSLDAGALAPLEEPADPFAADPDPFAAPVDADPFASGPAPADPFSTDDDPFAVPADEPTTPDEGFTLPLADDDELAAALAAASEEQPAPPPPPPPQPKKRRKPAKLKLAYPRADAMVMEYRENLRRGGCFIRTNKPLKVGRECKIEVRAPGLTDPILLDGVVTWSSAGQDSLAPGQSPGMGIEYRLDRELREAVEATLDGLA